MRKLVSQRERWQRVILETWWANRRMFLNPRYGTVGMLGMPFYFLSEIVAPLFEILAVATLVAGGALAGLVDWWEFAVAHARDHVRSTARSRPARCSMQSTCEERDVPALARRCASSLLMPLELFVYRPFMAWARVKGTWRFLRGDKGWHKFERNVRVGARRERPARAAHEGGARCSSLVSGTAQPSPRSSSPRGGDSREPSASGSRPRRRSALALDGPVRLLVRRRGPAARSRSRSQDESEVARNLLSAIPDGLLLVREGEICSVNRSLCELLGFDREELLGSTAPFPFWPPEHRHEIEAWHARPGRRAASHVAS